MLFSVKDVELVKQSIEYVDTAVLVCSTVSFDEGLVTSVIDKEYLERLSYVLEKEYRGRVFVLPQLQFPSVDDATERVLDTWVSNLKGYGFKHIMVITTNMEIKQLMDEKDEISLWLPSFSFDDNKEQVDGILLSQIRNIMKSVSNKWTLTE